MGTWNDTPTIANYLLPKGEQIFRIGTVRIDINARTGRREAILELQYGPRFGLSGEHSIPLEPWDTKPEAVAKFESIVKTNAVALNYVPSSDDLAMHDVVADFGEYLTELVGLCIKCDVAHVVSDQKKDNGEFFVNHKVRIIGLVNEPATV